MTFLQTTMFCTFFPQGDVYGTLVPYGGRTTPEYKAIKQNCNELISVFAEDPPAVVSKLYQADLYPSPYPHSSDPMDSARKLFASVELHIRRKAERFYRFLGVLLEWKGNEEIELLQDIHQTFVSKFIRSQIN